MTTNYPEAKILIVFQILKKGKKHMLKDVRQYGSIKQRCKQYFTKFIIKEKELYV